MRSFLILIMSLIAVLGCLLSFVTLLTPSLPLDAVFVGILMAVAGLLVGHDLRNRQVKA